MTHPYFRAAFALLLAAACLTVPPLAAQPFEVVPSPNVGAAGNALGGVDGHAADDVWAVGTYLDAGQSAYRTLAMRWDGDAWTVNPTPNPSSSYNRLSDVATPPGGAVWAVGSKGDGSTTRPMVLRREGGAWSEASLGYGGAGHLAAVHALAADDVWAVGATLRPDGFPDDGLALHYDGTSWTRIPLPNASVLHSLADVDASAPDAMWAVGTAWVSTFGSPSPLAYRWDGAAWAVVPVPFEATGLSAVAVLAPDDVWVAGRKTSGRGVMAHWDGAGWTVHDSQGPAPVRGVALAADGTPYAITDGEVYRYDAVAGQWNEAVGTFTGSFHDVAAGPGGHVWAGSGGVYGSLDGGQTWDWDPIHVSQHSGTPASILSVAVGPDQTVYAWGWRSTDNGQSWQAMSRALMATAFVGAAVYAGTFDGVYRSTTSGASWTPSGLDGTEVYAIAASSNGFVAATTDDLWHSADGATWTAAATLTGVRSLAATSDGAFWAAGGLLGSSLDGLHRSDDGTAWSLVPAAFAGQEVTDVAARGTTLLAAVDGVPHRSTDAGATWTPLTEGLSTTGGDPFTASDALVALAPDDVYAFGERVLHWDGTDWAEVHAFTELPDARLHDAVLLTDHTVWAAGRFVEDGVERTLTVRHRRSPVAVAAAPVNPPVLIPPGGGSFPFRVTLTNVTAHPQTVQAWTAVEGPVSREPVLGPRAVALAPGASVTRTLTQQVPGNAPAGTYTYHVRVGTADGTVLAGDAFAFTKQGAEGREVAAPGRSVSEAERWAVSGWDEAVASSVAGLPDGSALSAAHPNPSDGRTHLSLEVAAAQRVTAEVYDALGRRVAVLLDGAVEAGAHTLVLDGSSLPAGVYVVRVTGETFSATRRATLVR